jgi:hypothetical protein
MNKKHEECRQSMKKGKLRSFLKDPLLKKKEAGELLNLRRKQVQTMMGLLRLLTGRCHERTSTQTGAGKQSRI